MNVRTRKNRKPGKSTSRRATLLAAHGPARDHDVAVDMQSSNDCSIEALPRRRK